MGQKEVLDYLNEQTEPLTGGEIARGMQEKQHKISLILTKLLRHKEIKAKEIDRIQAKKRCKSCRRVKLYYI